MKSKQQKSVWWWWAENPFFNYSSSFELINFLSAEEKERRIIMKLHFLLPLDFSMTSLLTVLAAATECIVHLHAIKKQFAKLIVAML